MTDPVPNGACNLHRYHTIFMEIGLIGSLLIFIIALKADLPTEPSEVDFTYERETVYIEDIPQTISKSRPAAPADPSLLPTRPHARLQDPNLNIDPIDFTSTLAGPLDLPPETGNDPEEKIFMVVEQEPEIIGGRQALYKQLQYPDRCRRARIEGRVVLAFIVNTDGSVQDVKVIRGIGGGCDEAAVKALKKVVFRPGRQRGVPVRVRYHWPIVFELK